jgi:hypothetical protein
MVTYKERKQQVDKKIHMIYKHKKLKDKKMQRGGEKKKWERK